MTNDPTMSMKAATSGAVGNFIALALRTQRSLCQHVETSGSNTIFAGSRTAPGHSRLVRRGGWVPGFWWVGYGRAGGTVVNPYPPSFTARRPTPTGPIPPHLSVRRYVTSHTSAVRSRVSACLRSLTHSPVACLFFRVPVCGMHCAAASQSRHLHACAAGHASHGAHRR